MGYTRYFELKKRATKAEQKKIKTAAEKVLKEHSDIIQYESDITKPAQCEYNDSGLIIRFNGIEVEGHETFLFESYDTSWNFCKTSRKSYDIVVYKILTILEAVLGDKIDVSGDGTSFSEEQTNKSEFLKSLNL
jgi:hypothetical protein